MAWITLTEKDAFTVVNESLMTPLRTKALAANQPDPLFEHLIAAAGRVRGAIGAKGKYVLGAGDSIPAKLSGTTLNLFAVAMLGRLDLDVSPVKELLYKSAESTLRDLRNGEFDCEEPLTPTEEVSSNNSTPMISGNERQWGRAAQDGV